MSMGEEKSKYLRTVCQSLAFFGGQIKRKPWPVWFPKGVYWSLNFQPVLTSLCMGVPTTSLKKQPVLEEIIVYVNN